MDAIHQRVMALGKVLEFRRHHESALSHDGYMVCQTRAVAVFEDAVPPGERLAVMGAVLAEPAAPNFTRQYLCWADTDDYGRPTVEVHYTDVETARAACGTETG